MYYFLSVLYVTVCLFLILVVLLQSGKGGGLGVFGGGGGATVFGARGGANFLSRMTSVAAGAFMLLSIWLAHLSIDDSAIAAAKKASAEAPADEGGEAGGDAPDEGAGAGEEAAPAAPEAPAEDE